MFTGIIEEAGTLLAVNRGAKSSVLTIACDKVLEKTKIGDSIAVNGVCLTVTTMTKAGFTADVMAETMRRSGLGSLQKGERVNLERAMAAGGRFGGHIVSGHIEGVGTIRAIEREENAIWYSVEADSGILRYVVEKGSITIDGISLTVAYVDERILRVSVIPHTQKETNLTDKRTGSLVNLECDMIAKYIEKLMNTKASQTEREEGITEEFLLKNGF